MASFTLNPDDGRNVSGNRRTVTGIYTGPALYVTGGDPISANDVGLSDIRELDFGLAADANGANPRLLRLNAAGTKIMWYNPQTAAELVANAVLNGHTAVVRAVGR